MEDCWKEVGYQQFFKLHGSFKQVILNLFIQYTPDKWNLQGTEEYGST